ncbi:ArnT family glycosyltransferase [Coraliomargarita parva]|uniref:ArnT family glycosyltransferase n=1 Tax=Coraliomargarita parva TaxID=3014050 RepID=UPI0022B46C87|nr:glycosyltransferase family 39 protein [Coraliomargarita parva]
MTTTNPHLLKLSLAQKRFLWLGLGLLFLIRLLMVIQVPFADSTESRYAEIARKMVETNDWITPQFDYGVPFWGKPPLHTWVAAAGMKLFGVNQFGGRIFIFLSACAMLYLLFRWVEALRGRDYALVGTVVVFSSGIFFSSMAMVMTDLVMVAGTTLAMVAFWKAIEGETQSHWAGYGFFLGLAIGLLAKGPIAVVLAGLPIGAWVLLSGRWRDAWSRLPWLSGGLLALLITVPWYVAAEIKTPGFLQYFFVGEHFYRYTKPGWTGDLYGDGHHRAFGTIWVYWVSGVLPWSLFFIWPLIHFRKLLSVLRREEGTWLLYLLCWTVAPLLFFTFASNVIRTYVLTGVPAAGFLIMEMWRFTGTLKTKPSPMLSMLFQFALCVALLLYGWNYYVYTYLPDLAPRGTQKWLVAKMNSLQDAQDGDLYIYGERSYSAEFYTGGHSHVLGRNQGLWPLMSDGTRDFVAIRKGRFETLPEEVREAFEYEDSFRRYELYREKEPVEVPAETGARQLGAGRSLAESGPRA